jgi:hypothetical protein
MEMLNLALLFAPIQSFVVTTIIKGMTISNTLILLMMAKSFLTFRRKIITFTLLFGMVYILYFLIAQFSILIFDPNYIMDDLVYISKESTSQLYFRKSFITQSLYLFVDVIFFYFLLLYFKKYGRDKALDISFLSIIIFVIYGYFEFFMYLITGQNSDFISNRIAGENFKIGLFQTINIAGIQIQRLKSLAGEPSMFAFTVLPFFILGIYLKKIKTVIFLFITLLLSTSTSAVLGLMIWFVLDVIYRKNKLLKIVIFILFITVLSVLFFDVIDQFYTFIEAKLTLQNTSGIERFANFDKHFNAWYEASFINFLFGYGFGYVRSTDGLTTLLFNVGLIGLAVYILFFMLPYFMIRQKTDYIKGLYISNLSLLIVILISVPEFYYPHIWLFNALLWYEYLKEKQLIKYGGCR